MRPRISITGFVRPSVGRSVTEIGDTYSHSYSGTRYKAVSGQPDTAVQNPIRGPDTFHSSWLCTGKKPGNILWFLIVIVTKYNEIGQSPKKNLLEKVRITTMNKLCLVKWSIVFIACRTGMQYCPVSGCIQIFAALSCIAFIFVVSNKFQKPLVSGLRGSVN